MSSKIPDSVPATWSSVRGVVTNQLMGTLDTSGMLLSGNGSFNNMTPGGLNTWVVGDRLILAGQGGGFGTGNVQNGVYVISEIGASTWTLSRAPDARTAATLPNGRQWFVREEQQGGPSYGVWLCYLAPDKVVGTDPIACFPSDMRGRNPSVGPWNTQGLSPWPQYPARAEAGLPFVITFMVLPTDTSPVHIVESLPFDILILRTDVWVKEGAVDGTVQLMNGDLTVPLSGEFPAAAAGRVTDTGTGSEKPNEAPQNSAIYLKMSADTIEVALCIWAVRMAPPPNP